MNVTKENFEQTMIGVFYAFKASDYNSECFSHNEVIFHNACEENCINIVNKICEAGYNPYQLLINILSHLKINNLRDNFDQVLKTQIDNNFQIEIEDYYVHWGLEKAKNHSILV